MRRGEVRLVDLEPAHGSEANKVRPAVIVSNDHANRAAERASRGVITVVPMTSNVERVLPFQVLVPAAGSGLRRDSKAKAEQIRAISVDRVGAAVGRLPGPVVQQLDAALRRHLAL